MSEPPTPQLDSTRTTAVDPAYYWQPMSSCPRGVKVQLRGAGGVATYGQYDGKENFWTHWAPLPVLPKHLPQGLPCGESNRSV